MSAAFRRARFSIKGCQRDQDGGHDELELITEGKVSCDNGRITVEYDESTMSDGGDHQTTRLELQDGRIMMARSGDFGLTLCFEEGRRFQSFYETPYGSIAISVFGNAVSYNMDEQGGKISLDYIVDLEGNASTMNTLDIDVRFA